MTITKEVQEIKIASILKELESNGRKTNLERYIYELERIKHNIKIENELNYKGKKYIIEAKYDTFVVLRGKNYRTSMMYDNFVRRKADGSVIYG